MGYKPGRKVYNLQFEDYPELEVRCKGTSLGKLLYLSKLNVKINEEDEEKRMEVFTYFSSRLLSWNLEHPDNEDDDNDICTVCGLQSGDPLPVTVQGMLCLELAFIMTIIFGWMAAISRVAPPKELNSRIGERTQEDLMRQLSEHQSPMISPLQNSFLA